jgi:hypothetical protein
MQWPILGAIEKKYMNREIQGPVLIFKFYCFFLHLLEPMTGKTSDPFYMNL